MQRYTIAKDSAHLSRRVDINDIHVSRTCCYREAINTWVYRHKDWQITQNTAGMGRGMLRTQVTVCNVETQWSHKWWNYTRHKCIILFFSSIHIALACLTCIKESGVLWHHKALLGHQTSLAFRTLSVNKDLVCHHGWGVVCFPCGGWLPLWEDAWGMRGLGGVVRALQGAIGVGWLSQLYCRC